MAKTCRRNKQSAAIESGIQLNHGTRFSGPIRPQHNSSGHNESALVGLKMQLHSLSRSHACLFALHRIRVPYLSRAKFCTQGHGSIIVVAAMVVNEIYVGPIGLAMVEANLVSRFVGTTQRKVRPDAMPAQPFGHGLPTVAPYHRHTATLQLLYLALRLGRYERAVLYYKCLVTHPATYGQPALCRVLRCNREAVHQSVIRADIKVVALWHDGQFIRHCL